MATIHTFQDHLVFTWGFVLVSVFMVLKASVQLVIAENFNTKTKVLVHTFGCFCYICESSSCQIFL